MTPEQVRRMLAEHYEMVAPGEHCGHDCCGEPHNPLHDHWLDPDECNQCVRVRDERLDGEDTDGSR